jgi:hypothetical protein
MGDRASERLDFVRFGREHLGVNAFDQKVRYPRKLDYDSLEESHAWTVSHNIWLFPLVYRRDTRGFFISSPPAIADFKLLPAFFGADSLLDNPIQKGDWTCLMS